MLHLYPIKKISFETGLMMLSDTHVRDSIILHYGQNGSGPYGFSKITFKHLGMPIQLSIHSGPIRKFVFSGNAGVLLTDRLFFETRNF